MAKVLLIEPDAVLATTYEHALQQVGHKVRASATAQDAIDAADELGPDVIVLELQLVAHSGIEFLYELRSYPEWQSVPAIVLSNVPPAVFNTSKTILQQYLGVHTYCYKPRTSLAQLIRIIDTVVMPA